ncbi:MAG: efflux RND transporter permease subunit, partial [Desulfobacterales bacterium]|nr:efflux RND transporter permease subunit [Desulfobacterales bacterium]
MFSRFFIERPIFATVVSIVIVIAGLVAVLALPISQYPEITPPTVEVTTSYPGASAQVLAETVASPIEQEVNGVEGMIYMQSRSASDGRYTLTVTFEVGMDVDMAQILVQNRVDTALPKLPEEVKRQGVNTKKKSTAFLLFIALTSPDGRYDNLFLNNYATLNIKDELSRIYGVGDVDVFGDQDYSMRIWLDPEQLKARDLAAGDVIRAIEEQNIQVAAGQIGQPPAP